MEKITISMTIQEWNVVMNALSHRPFGEVVAVINNINEQAKPQITDTVSQ